MLPEIAVFSGDTVRRDEEGFLYFIGRRDEMIKTSGYRVSPTEIEEVLYGTQLVGEAAAFGVPHPVLGQAIVVVATPQDGAALDARARCSPSAASACRRTWCRRRSTCAHGPLPRNPNGKIDRKALAGEFAGRCSRRRRRDAPRPRHAPMTQFAGRRRLPASSAACR